MSCRLGIKIETEGKTLTAGGSCVVRYKGEFFILCVLSGIPPEELEKEQYRALALPDSDLIYLALDYVIKRHERSLAATGGTQDDRLLLVKFVALRDALHEGREDYREVYG